MSRPEIHPRKQQPKFLLVNLPPGLFRTARPGKAVFLQSLLPHAESGPVPVQRLQDPSLSVAEQEQRRVKRTGPICCSTRTARPLICFLMSVGPGRTKIRASFTARLITAAPPGPTEPLSDDPDRSHAAAASGTGSRPPTQSAVAGLPVPADLSRRLGISISSLLSFPSAFSLLDQRAKLPLTTPCLRQYSLCVSPLDLQASTCRSHHSRSCLMPSLLIKGICDTSPPKCRWGSPDAYKSSRRPWHISWHTWPLRGSLGL